MDQPGQSSLFARRACWIALLLWSISAVVPACAGDDDRNIDKLIEKLSSADVELQHSALDDLWIANKSAMPAIPALMGIVKESNEENRKHALQFLGEFGPRAKSAVPVVLDALKDSSRNIQIEAAAALLEIQGANDAAVEVLNSALRNGNNEQRLDVAWKVYYLGRSARGTAPELIEAVNDPDPKLRAKIATALGAIGPVPENASLTTLRTLLADNAPEVRVQAARSLWQLDQPADTLLPKLMRIIKDYRPDPNRSPSEEFVFDQDLPARVAIELLGEIGPQAKPAVPALLEVIDRSTPTLQFPAVDALGKIGSDDASVIEQLGRTLREAEPFSFPFVHRVFCLSDEAGIALRRIGPASTSVLLSALPDPDARVRANAADALGYVRADYERVIPELLKRLDDEEASVRALAAYALGRIGSPAASSAPALAAHLNDDGKWGSSPGSGIVTNYSVDDHILTALQNISPPPESIVPAIVKELQTSRAISAAMCELLRLLGPQAKPAVPALVPLLDDRKLRVMAAAAISRIEPGHDGLLIIFREALVEKEGETNLLAARGLGDLGTRATGGLPDLYAQIELNQDPSIKAILAAAIVRIDRGQTKAVIELASALRDSALELKYSGHDEAERVWASLGEDAEPGIDLLTQGLTFRSSSDSGNYYRTQQYEERIRLNCAERLIEVSQNLPQVIDALIDLCQSDDCGYRGWAADLLAKIGPDAVNAAPTLAKLLADQEFYSVGGDFYGYGGVRYEPCDRAVLTLLKIGTSAVPSLRAALKDDEPLARQHAAEALGKIGSSSRPAVDDLIAALDDYHHSVRAAAARALGQIGDTRESVISAQIQALSDRHLEVRLEAATALGTMGKAAQGAEHDLANLQADRFEAVRNAAADALRKISRK